MDELESVNHRIAELQAELSKLEERRDKLLSTVVRIEQAALTVADRFCEHYACLARNRWTFRLFRVMFN